MPRTLSSHGDDRVDEFYWLRDDHRKDAAILAYLEAENDYAKQQLAPLMDLENRLFEEMKGRLVQDDATVPFYENGAWYYWRYETGKEYPIFCRKLPDLEGVEQVLLDENQRAEGHGYYGASGLEVSPDSKLLACAEDTVGRRIYTIRIKDLATDSFLPVTIEATSGNLAWADSKTLFYVRKEAGTLRDYQVWRHQLGSDPSQDVLVFEEKDAEFHLRVWRTRSQEFVVISSYQTLVTEHRILDLRQPTGEFAVFLPREDKHEHHIDHGGDHWYVRSNWQAENFRLLRVPSGKAAGRTSDKASWQEVVPHRPSRLLAGVAVFRDHVIVREREAGLTALRLLPRGGDKPWAIEFTEPVFTANIGTNREYAPEQYRYTYSSLTTPTSVFDYDPGTRVSTLRKQQKVLGGFDRNDYVSRRIYATSRDGTKVPISIVHRRDLDLSQPRPLYLYGYGAYGLSMDPTFSSSRLSLLDRGFVFAIAHIRGGQEMGRRWYEQGKLLHKKNTFNDFIDCGEALIAEGLTSKGKLVASGGSAGGLLVGAVVNMRPDLFGAVVAKVPFVDVVTTMLDESIPLTTFEYDEWGNPNQEAFYRYMLSYSPYDNVEAQDYPDIFVFTGLHDSQVQYWEPAKWVARLRQRKTDDNMLLFHTNMESGHGGASGRFRQFRELAMEYAFLLDRLGDASR